MIEPRTTLPEISTVDLLKVRYAIHRFWELEDFERETVQTIVDTRSVGDLAEKLDDVYLRLREKKACLQSA